MELDDAFANAAYIPEGDTYPDKWADLAKAFRAQAVCELDLPYGERPRQKYDLFHPGRLAKGVVIFVHGGYWLRFDKSYWSHLAAGPLAQGWAVAMPSYDLCPDVSVTQIGQQVAAAISTISARVPGPVRLVGHSAGGQLVARMTARRDRWIDRIERVVPVSPVADLAPLLRTSMNGQLQIDAAEAAVESPICLKSPSVPVTVWVGGDERPVFVAQATALAELWQCPLVVVPNVHHFNVLDPLTEPDSELTHTVLS